MCVCVCLYQPRAQYYSFQKLLENDHQLVLPVLNTIIYQLQELDAEEKFLAWLASNLSILSHEMTH